MSTIKVDTIATRTGSGNITLSNNAVLSGDLTVDTNTLKVDAANNRVGVGNASPNDVLHIKRTDGTTVGNVLNIDNSAGSSTHGAVTNGIRVVSDNNGYWANLRVQGHSTLFDPQGSGTKVRIDADGLKFGTDTASANALDDYEEGDWTPTVIATGGSPSIGYSSQVGKYVKIGKMVTVWCRITVSSISGGSGQAKIEGLPVITENTEAMRGNSHVMLDQLSNNRRTASIQADPNGTTLTLIRDSGSTPSHAALTFSDITAGTDIRFQYSYRVP